VSIVSIVVFFVAGKMRLPIRRDGEVNISPRRSDR